MTFISVGAVEYTANKNIMKNKTLVKVKIVLSDDGANLVTYFWKKTFWMFGYWYPFGSSYCTGTQPTRKVERVTDANVSKVLYDNFIHNNA